MVMLRIMPNPEALARISRVITARSNGRSAPNAPAPVATRTDCLRRSAGPLETAVCGSCKGRVELKVFGCEVYGRCAPGKAPDGVRSCVGCADRRTDWPIHYDEHNLWPGVPGKRFNPSLVAWGDGYALCFRNGWKGSDLYVGLLDKDFQPVGRPVRLDIRHPDCNYGREDPRLHRAPDGTLSVVFAGVVGGSRIRHTNVLVARLDDQFRVTSVTHPHIDGRNLWEKNHSYFSHDGREYAVYSVQPHRIVRLVDGKAEWFAEEGPSIPWDGGELRGGAPPVRVGDEFWSFVHDRVVVNGAGLYRTALYTFEAKPPFRPLRYIPHPILTADPKTKPADQYIACVFVCGAVRVGPDWVLSHGVHDRWTELHKFAHADLERQLVPIENAAPEPLPRDCVIGAFLVQGDDPHKSGRKVGVEVAPRDLTTEKKAEYMAPFAHTSNRFGAASVLIHDGLPADLVARFTGHNHLSFRNVVTGGHPSVYERRWFALRKLLRESKCERVWLVDANDVVFTTDPFDWLTEHVPAGSIAAGQEHARFREGDDWNPWYADQWAGMLPRYGDEVKDQHADEYPLSCGCWGGRRADVLSVLDEMCCHIEIMQRHLSEQVISRPVMLDMSAFQATLFPRAGRVVRFWQSGNQVLNGVPSPLIHDRPRAMAHIAQATAPVMLSASSPGEA